MRIRYHCLFFSSGQFNYWTIKWKLALSSVWLTVLKIFLLTLLVTDGAIAHAQTSTLDAIKTRGILRAGIRIDNPPHSFINAQGLWVGFDVDIAEALAKGFGVKLDKVKVDQLTRISYLQSAKIDIAVASMSHTHKRDQEIDFSQTYFWSKQTFLVKAGGVERLAELAGKPVGMDRGSHAMGNWRDWLIHHGYAFDPKLVVEFGDKQIAIQALRQGAILGYAQDYEILSSFAKQDPSLVVIESESIGQKQDGIGMRENDSKLRDAINFSLQSIETSGEYERIYLRWFGPDSDAPVPLERRIEVWPHG